MNTLRITDLGNGEVRVALHRGDSVDECPHPLPFQCPLSEGDREELRWYLEDFVQFPYGAEQWRAKQLEKKMEEWGELIFAQVFPKTDSTPDPHSLYTEGIKKGYRNCELCITSTDPAFLSIPWELIRTPDDGGRYIAAMLGGLYRRHTGIGIGEKRELAAGEPFRILLVIARPSGEEDVPMGTVARPVLEAIRPLRPRIELEVLRPPTFGELTRRLNERPGYYHLVHFDGHGDFVPGMDVGVLAFENEKGETDLRISTDLGQSLADSRVPHFILNACRSARQGDRDPYSSVASQLLATGADGVVAMSYSVYAGPAGSFMRRLYERLVEHDTLAKAVTEARCSLYSNRSRRSVAGQVELRDWIVPTLFQRETGYVPIPKGEAKETEEDKKAKELLQHAEDACPEGQYAFIGCDNYILAIERAIRDSERPWVLVSGMGGIGKTELAFGFARWYTETGGCPGGVFMTSFKEKADFGQVIGSIVGFGTDFSRLPDEEQLRQIVDYLRENACLLVWDNFEPVGGYPVGTEPLATPEEREKLSRFLKALRHGKSRVLITSRKTDERWLGIAYRPVELEGLTQWDASQLAGVMLSTAGVKPEEFQDDPDYSELIKLLRGHPRSLEVTMPLLRSRSPREVIDAIRHGTSRLGLKVKDATMSVAFAQMSERTRRHLPFLGLFASHVYLPTLCLFVAHGDERQKAYEEVMGEALDRERWEEVLEEAAGNGFIDDLSNGLYRMHPTLPPFLREQLVGGSSIEQQALDPLDTEFVSFYENFGGVIGMRLQKGETNALHAAAWEESNLLRALRLAQEKDRWQAARNIGQTVEEFYGARGRWREWNSLRARLLDWVGREMPDVKAVDKGALWKFLMMSEAKDSIRRQQPRRGEQLYEQVLVYLRALDGPDVQLQIAGVYQGLGIAAQAQSQTGKAVQRYHEARTIYEKLDCERETAGVYYQLGLMLWERGDYEGARQWLEKALDVYRRLDMERVVGSVLQVLSDCALGERRFKEADEYVLQALSIAKRMGQLREVAIAYHQFGRVKEEQGQLDEAQQYYRNEVIIWEDLGMPVEQGKAYHQLGMVAEKRARFEVAEQWYFKALELIDRAIHPPLKVKTLAAIGLLRWRQRRHAESLQWFGKAFAIAVEYKMPIQDKIIVCLAGAMRAMGEKEFAAEWRKSIEELEPPIRLLREAKVWLREESP